MRCSYGHRTWPHGNPQCFSYPTGRIRGPCVTRKGANWHVRELTQPELAKIPHGRRIWPHGARTVPLRSSHELFTGCLRSVNPYGARKLIKHAFKLYGPRTGGNIRTAPHGARAGPVSGRTVFVLKSPKSSGTAREQPARGPGVWCDWGITVVTIRGNMASWQL